MEAIPNEVSVLLRGHRAIDSVLYWVAIPEHQERLPELSCDYAKIHFVLLRDFTEHKQNAQVRRRAVVTNLRLEEFLEATKERRFLRDQANLKDK